MDHIFYNGEGGFLSANELALALLRIEISSFLKLERFLAKN
jgi:hypothetical protein